MVCAFKSSLVQIWYVHLQHRPEGGSEQLGSIMLQCHNHNPKARPTFSQILTILLSTKSPERKMMSGICNEPIELQENVCYSVTSCSSEM